VQGSEFIDMMKKVLGVTTNKELASFLGITAEHISRLYKQESLSEKYVDRRLIHAHKEIQRRARKQAFQTAISPLVEFYPIDLTLRACLETHLSIMKRFNSMLAMAI